MEQLITTQAKSKPAGTARRLLLLSAAGDVMFWATSVLTSLLPIAAEYRAALSNWRIEFVWIGSLLMGIPIALFVSAMLLRGRRKAAVSSPVGRAAVLSILALIVALVLVDLPMMFRSGDVPFRYFLIGTGFNLVRFLLLGITIGGIQQRLGRKAGEPQHE